MNVLILMLALLAVRAPAPADTLEAAAAAAEPPGRAWRAGLRYSYEHLSGGRAPWQAAHLHVARRFRRGTLALEGIRVQRFGQWNRAAAADGYLELWNRAYGNLRLQLAPASRLLPEADLYAELFQAVGKGWELSGSWRRRQYAEDTFHFAGVGVGRYVGNWYLRGRSTLFPFAGRIGFAHAVLARRYWEPPRSFFEFGAGAGRGLEVVAAGPVVAVTRTYFVTARVQRYLTDHLGLSLKAGYGDDELYRRRSLVFGLLARW